MTCTDRLSQEGMWPAAQISTEQIFPEGPTAEGWLASALPAAGVTGSSLNPAGPRAGPRAGLGAHPRPQVLLTETTLQSVNHHY